MWRAAACEEAEEKSTYQVGFRFDDIGIIRTEADSVNIEGTLVVTFHLITNADQTRRKAGRQAIQQRIRLQHRACEKKNEEDK